MVEKSWGIKAELSRGGGAAKPSLSPESSQADSQRPTWGVLVSESMEDLTHAASCCVCVCVCEGQSSQRGDVKWVLHF